MKTTLSILFTLLAAPAFAHPHILPHMRAERHAARAGSPRFGGDRAYSLERGAYKADPKGRFMKPGELVCAAGDITLNEGREAIELMVANTGDRPVQVGSHYHFAETNPTLEFDRAAAHGQRLNIAAGTAVRFEPGQKRAVSLIKIAGSRRVFGFNGKIMGDL